MISDILDPLESNKDEVSDTHLRVCLEIAKELLKHSQSTNRNRQELDPILLGLEATVLVLSYYKETATRFGGIFVTAATFEEDADVRLNAVKALLDLWCQFGVNLPVDEIGGVGEAPALRHSDLRGWESILAVLRAFFDPADEKLLFVATQGLCKLFLADVLKDSNLLLRLIVIFFTVETPDIQQCLSAFFKLYPMHGKAKEHQDILEGLFVPAIRAFTAHPKPALQQKSSFVGRFLLDLFTYKKLLADALCEEILRDPDGDPAKFYPSLLNALSLSPLGLKVLKCKCQALLCVVTLPTALKSLRLFSKEVDRLEPISAEELAQCDIYADTQKRIGVLTAKRPPPKPAVTADKKRRLSASSAAAAAEAAARAQFEKQKNFWKNVDQAKDVLVLSPAAPKAGKRKPNEASNADAKRVRLASPSPARAAPSASPIKSPPSGSPKQSLAEPDEVGADPDPAPVLDERDSLIQKLMAELAAKEKLLAANGLLPEAPKEAEKQKQVAKEKVLPKESKEPPKAVKGQREPDGEATEASPEPDPREASQGRSESKQKEAKLQVAKAKQQETTPKTPIFKTPLKPLLPVGSKHGPTEKRTLPDLDTATEQTPKRRTTVNALLPPKRASLLAESIPSPSVHSLNYSEPMQSLSLAPDPVEPSKVPSFSSVMLESASLLVRPLESPSAESPSKRQRTVKAPVFKIVGFEPAERARLVAMAEALGASVLEGGKFDHTVTHVVCTPASREPAVISAALTGRWIVGAAWLTECAQRASLLPPDAFGLRASSPIAGKKVFVHQTLEKASLVRTYLKLGKAVVWEQPGSADLRVAPPAAGLAAALSFDQLITSLLPKAFQLGTL